MSRAGQSDVTTVDGDLDFVRDRCLQCEGGDRVSSDVGIGPVHHHADGDVVGDRTDAAHALGDALGTQLVPVRIDEAGQRHDPVLRRHTDRARIDVRIPVQFPDDEIALPYVRAGECGSCHGGAPWFLKRPASCQRATSADAARSQDFTRVRSVGRPRAAK